MEQHFTIQMSPDYSVGWSVGHTLFKCPW